MQIELESVKETTELCRYCLMCRHVCPVTHVTRTEATSPHGWGILVASVERGVTAWNEDTVDVLYQCADCGLCRAHCATDQPLPLAINAARAEVVDQNLAPPAVYDVQAKLSAWENPYVESSPTAATGRGEAALIVGAVGHHLQPETVAAATRLLEAAGEDVAPVAIGRESPYLANSLGLLEEARTLAQATLAEIKAIGAKRVYVLSPGDHYAFATVLEFLGMAWPTEVELTEVTTFLAQKLEAGQLNFKAAELSDYTFVDPDQTVRFPGRWDGPRTLLAALTENPLTELFWRRERAAPSGVSGGLALTQPELSKKLVNSRLDEARQRGIKTLITDDPQVLYHLRQQNSDLAVEGLYELLAAHLS